MNILFRGGGFSNKGDEAMMLTVQRELTKRLPRANFVLRTSKESLEKAHSHGLLASASSGTLFQRACRLAGAYAIDADVRRASRLDKITAEAIAEIKEVDCVVDFSGFNYSDLWGVTCARRGLAWADYCNKHGRPYICLPQAWGPFQLPAVAKGTRQLCRYSSLVYARDKVSLSFLSELLGPDGDGIRIGPDIAFLFPGASSQAGREALKSLGIDVKSSPLVGIAPNMRVYERCQGLGAANEYIQILIKVADHCIHAWDASVVLLPHEFSMHRIVRKDDRFLCGLVKVGVSDSDRCFMLRTNLSASLIKAIESQLDFMIGSRFHSCVFALSSSVPAVALGWAHKYPELMKLVGLDGNALIHTQFTDKCVIELLDAAWERRDQSKAAIRERLPEIRKQAAKVFDDVAGILAPNK